MKCISLGCVEQNMYVVLIVLLKPHTGLRDIHTLNCKNNSNVKGDEMLWAKTEEVQ